MKLIPGENRIAVKIVRRDESPGGIVLPENANRGAAEYGEVAAVGTPRMLDCGVPVPIEFVKTGDVVLFGAYSGIDVEINEQTFRILRMDDVLVRLDK